MSNQPKKFGGVALIGATNAGKSTLVNAMVGEKIAITSRKVQTTRFQIRGIAIHNNAQIVLIDTPGFFKPRRKFDRAMIASAWQSLDDVEITAFLIDATRPYDKAKNKEYLDRIVQNTTEDSRILILNKVDAVRKDKLLQLTTQILAECPFAKVFMVSALNGDGVTDVLDWCTDKLPEGDWVYDEDEVTTLSSRLLAAEITREKIYDRLHQELPYKIAVETEAFNPADNGKGFAIEQVIIIEEKKHKGIVLGSQGRTLKIIGSDARAEMMELFQCPIHLKLYVQHRAGWLDKDEAFSQLIS